VVDLIMVLMIASYDLFEGPFGKSELIESLEFALRGGHRRGLADQRDQRQFLPIRPREPRRAGSIERLRAEIGDDIESIEHFRSHMIRRLVEWPFKSRAEQNYSRLCIVFLAPAGAARRAGRPAVKRDGHCAF